MKKELLQTKWTFITGALLAFPAIYFVTANVLNYELGIGFLWKPINAFFENPVNAGFGWNISLFLLIGPVIAVVLNALSLCYIRFEKAGEYFRFQLFIKRKWWNITLLLTAAGTLLALFLYLFYENIASR